MTKKSPPQAWYEMAELRRRRFADSIWIPLRALQTLSEEGDAYKPGHVREFLGAGSIAVPLQRRKQAEELVFGIKQVIPF